MTYNARMEKVDARKLTAEGREMLRRTAIRLRQQSGMPVKALATVTGVHVRTVESWHKLSMISAISPRGEVAFRIVEGSINAERFREFLAALIENASRKIFLVVDNLRVHHAKLVEAYFRHPSAAYATRYI